MLTKDKNVKLDNNALAMLPYSDPYDKLDNTLYGDSFISSENNLAVVSDFKTKSKNTADCEVSFMICLLVVKVK